MYWIHLLHHDSDVTVNQACDEIWKCQEPKQAALWLELLHHALLRTSLDAYLPSDVFMCISGAALRFPKEHPQQQQDDSDILWKVWEEAMWAAAALARVCVGAAWRFQLRQRREWLSRRKHNERDEKDGTATSKSSSHSPRTMPLSIIATDSNQNPRSYSPMTSHSPASSSHKCFTRHTKVVSLYSGKLAGSNVEVCFRRNDASSNWHYE